MLKKTIAYTDFDGNKRQEDFYFNLTSAEIVKLNASSTGGLDKLLQKLVREEDAKRILEHFDTIILGAYGEKSLDGRSFIKVGDDGRKLSDKFVQSAAYSALFMEMFTAPGAAAAFINGIVPQELAEQAAANPQLMEPVE